MFRCNFRTQTRYKMKMTTLQSTLSLNIKDSFTARVVVGISWNWEDNVKKCEITSDNKKQFVYGLNLVLKSKLKICV